MESAPELRDEILKLVERYHAIAHAPKRFVPGETKIPYAGRVFDADELQRGVDSVLQFWLTAGPFAQEFEREMHGLLQIASAAYPRQLRFLRESAHGRHAAQRADQGRPPPRRRGHHPRGHLSHHAHAARAERPHPRLRRLPAWALRHRRGKNRGGYRARRRARFSFPHTVGIPADLDVLTALANKHDLWFLEDGCDALGSTWDGKLCGTFGAMSSISFYPAHHMTMGEGGMVIVNDNGLRKTCLSVRDWGRDCWCDPGVSDTCNKRFGWQLGDLPFGYDHKYTYSNLGYNLKVSEMQAAVGCAQFRKLPQFIAARKKNAKFYLERLRQFEEHLILPTVPAKADVSWFCFPITLKDHINRREFQLWLEDAKIETRLVFAGNVLKQPGFRDIPRRVVGDLTGTDTIMNQTLFLGVYPGLTDDMLEFVVDRIGNFFKR